MTARFSLGKRCKLAEKPEVEPPCPILSRPSVCSMRQPKPYFIALPLLSLPGVHICSRLGVFSKVPAFREAFHLTRSPIVDTRAPAANTSVRSESRLIQT